jgi:membrane protein DedA with SNARE-associated domain
VEASPLAESAVALVLEYGPWIIFAMALAETCFITGLAVPAGVATAVGTALALDGQMSLLAVVAAAVAGAAAGDTLGFWIGRWAGERLEEGDGWASRVYGRYRPGADRFLGRHPLYAVTLARWVSFVRTLMPTAAGMGRIPYRTFLLYDAAGVTGWLVMYTALGVVGREGWRQVAPLVGGGWMAVFVAVGLILWAGHRRRRAEEPC